MALEIAAKLAPVTTIVLIGGQALNFWAERFRIEDPELNDLAPFESKDIDFLGTASDVRLCARYLKGTARFPSADHSNTPQVGLVVWNDGGVTRQIDILGSLAGLDRAEVERTAVQVEIAADVALRVMHPVAIVRSRLANIAILRRHDELTLRQMRASVHAVSAYIKHAASSDSRAALGMIEALQELATSRHGLQLWHAHQIDIALAVRSYHGLPDEFATRRLPRLRARLDTKRKNYEKNQIRIASRSRGRTIKA